MVEVFFMLRLRSKEPSGNDIRSVDPDFLLQPEVCLNPPYSVTTLIHDRFFEEIESMSEKIQPDHPEICALAAEGFVFLQRLEDWYQVTIPRIESQDAYLKLALAIYHALHLFIYKNYTYYTFWDRSEIPILAEDEARIRIAAIISSLTEIINDSHIPGILTLFTLRVAGVAASEPLERAAILGLLHQIAQKGFVVSRRIIVDLRVLWEYEGLGSLQYKLEEQGLEFS
jgi:hypothetical protein